MKQKSKGVNRKEMYKTEIKNFVLGDNISISVMQERGESGSHYGLLKISLFGRATYAICVLGDGYALECVGENEEDAMGMFEMTVSEKVSPIHLFDIISDLRHESEL